MTSKFVKVTRVIDYSKHPNGIELKCSLEDYAAATVNLRFVDPEMVKFRFSLGSTDASSQWDDPVIVLDEGEVEVELVEQSEKLILKSKRLQVEINLDPWQLCFRDSEGRLLTKSVTEDKTTWNQDLNKPFGISCVSRDQDVIHEVTKIHYTHLLNYNEDIYGFGETFGRLNKKGQRITMWTSNGQGVRSQRTYKPIPFFISTNGYGILLNNPHRSEFNVGSPSNRALGMEVSADFLEYYFILGPEPLKIIENYAKLTGYPALPPKWSFGLWLSSYFIQANEESVRNQIDNMRDLDIPCDVYHFDCYWLRRNMWNDFTWDQEAFPNPDALLQELHEKNYKVCIWINPYVSSMSELFAEGAKNGYFLKRKDGTVYNAQTWRDGINPLTGIVDVTNPEAVEWFQNHLKNLIEQGADVFKTDFGEDIPEDAVYYNGRPGSEMHNLYNLLYNKMVFELTAKETGNHLVWARSAWAGSQRYPTHWGGDPHATWEDMASTLRGGLSFSMSGMAFWSHDIGGFKGDPDAKLFIRWAQFGLFSPHARLHGWGNRDPWNFGQEALDIFRECAKLRYRLIPYLFSYAKIAHDKGHPVMRPMVMNYPDDPAARDLEHQYMLGNELLVAPVLSPDDTVQVYLPDGFWWDYWTGNCLEGGRFITRQVPLDEFPLFVKCGSMVPMGPEVDHVGDADINDLTINIFLDPHDPKDQAFGFPLYDDQVYPLECTKTEGMLAFENHGDSSNKNFNLVIHGAHRPTRVEIDGQEGNPASSWSYEGGKIFVAGVKHKAVLRFE